MKTIFKKGFAFVAIISLVAVGIPLFGQTATESFLDFSITVEDSAPEATDVTYTVSFTTGEGISDGSDIILDFNYEGEDGETTFIDAEGVLHSGAEIVEGGNFGDCSRISDDTAMECTSEENIASDTELKMELTVDNPERQGQEGESDTYLLLLTNEDGDDIIERGTSRVAILDPVTVTARIDATLTFDVMGVDPDEGDRDGEFGAGTIWDQIDLTDDIATEPNLIPFGTIEPGEIYTAAQDLYVRTNATDGYTVTVFQDGNLMSAAGDEIAPFNNGDVATPSSRTPWTEPEDLLDDEDTWGHFGFTTEDDHITDDGCDPEADGNFRLEDDDVIWAGFDGSEERTVMCYTGPVPDPDSTLEQNVNYTRVGYQVEISQLQPAGEYNNTLTYIATPTF